ncbi:hypothetical protein QYZ43_21195 [Vibrio parahaemolyticus]|nr:hypothetical protein [Vibrio parahaemolyticus]MDN4715564.1 hypothetical protein [Vibrio parahaemolyticus]MDN4719576.1 hypothetical protein [Vibrio parahaemolyticus]MDN4723413.1 hypothetical protein [Vibrio parahaemolyticus]MDN4727726.1 hypothetical protein [Vibrio parahaemolyticus]
MVSRLNYATKPIGDQVKMLQQTLLYWLKICRDEQMAMAQNI